MAQYLLRKGKIHYEIAKFEDSSSPVAVYIFGARGCSCPSYQSFCKHASILKAWKAAGEPVGAVYNDTGNIINNLF